MLEQSIARTSVFVYVEISSFEMQLKMYLSYSCIGTIGKMSGWYTLLAWVFVLFWMKCVKFARATTV